MAGPGTTAIEQALARVYGEGPWAREWPLGGPEPLTRVVVCDGGNHWHYLSFGLSEQEEKLSAYPDRSGWGIELGIRLLHQEVFCQANGVVVTRHRH